MRIITIAFIIWIALSAYAAGLFSPGASVSTTAAVLARDLPDGPVLSDVKTTIAQASANW